MDAQSRAARREGAQVAAEKVEGAEEDAHKEQKWQSFMEKHFGEGSLTDVHGPQYGVLLQVNNIISMQCG